MPIKLGLARSANANLVQKQPLVAVCTGSTRGIGEYTVRALAKHHGTTGKGLRIYLVGRNPDAAAKITKDCQELTPSAEIVFIKASDLAILKDVDRVCDEIIALEKQKAGDGIPKIDLLCMSHCDPVWWGERRETSEGLDISMSHLYYSRMRFTIQLMPLLSASLLPAHVISIYAAGYEKRKNWYPDDLSLRKCYSLPKYRTHVTAMTTFYMERLAQQHGISLTNAFPALVITPGFKDPSFPLWFKTLATVLVPVAKALIAISPEEIGERMLYLASERFPARQQTDVTSEDIAVSTDGVRGGGSYSCDYDGSTNNVEGFYQKIGDRQAVAKKVCEHTDQVFAQIAAGGVFRD